MTEDVQHTTWVAFGAIFAHGPVIFYWEGMGVYFVALIIAWYWIVIHGPTLCMFDQIDKEYNMAKRYEYMDKYWHFHSIWRIVF